MKKKKGKKWLVEEGNELMKERRQKKREREFKIP